MIIKDKDLPSSSLTQLIQNHKIPNCYVEMKDGKLLVNARHLYWEFMKEQINEGVRRREPNALYILAELFYWDDDRFDNYNTRGMRVAAAKMAKEAAEKGHNCAKDLYDISLFCQLEAPLSPPIYN